MADTPPEDSPHPVLVEQEMGETFSAMANANAKRLSIPREPASFSRKDVVNAFQAAFELTGGVPRLAAWAHENYSDFAKLYARLLPSQSHQLIEASGEIRILHSIAPGALDGVESPPSQEVIEGDFEESA